MPVGDTQVVKTGRPREMRAKKREAQDAALVLLAQGHTIQEAMERVGRRRETFYVWCRDEDWFKDRAAALRTRSKDESIPDFTAFRHTYFGFDTPSHQEKVIDAIEAAEPRSITMILLPPGGGKTTVLEDYYCYKLAKDPNYRIAAISETRDLVRKILRNVSNRMSDRNLNPSFIDNFGPFRPSDRSENKPWNADILTHVQADSGQRDYSFEVKGAGSSIYGSSFDLIVLDDIQSSKSLNKTEALLIYFRQTLFSRIMRANSTGRIIIVGTRQGPGDFYEELLKTDIIDRLVKIPALDEHGHSYFPKRKDSSGEEIGFSEEDLARIEMVVQPEAWSRQYMQEPISKHGQTFTEKMIEDSLDITRGIDPSMAPGTYRIAGLDPALAGHAVFRVAGFDYDKLYLLDGRNAEGLGRYEEMWDIIEELTIKWHPQAWIIEGNAIQGGIARSDRIQAMSEKYGFSIVSHQTGRNKQDEQIGVASMAGTFLRKELSIPWGTPEAKASFATMCDELRSWRPDVPTRYLRQDEVMCLWFIHLHWQKMRHQLASRIDRRVKVQGLPWKPTSYKQLVGSR